MAWSDPPAFTAIEQLSTAWDTYMKANLEAQGEAAKCIFIDPTVDSDGGVGTWAITTDVAAPNDPYGYGLSHGTDGDTIRFYEYLSAGAWTINIQTALRNDYGILRCRILTPALVEIADAGTFNCYTSNGVAQFTLASPLDFAITQPGMYVISLEVDGQDIHSTGSTIRIFGIYLQKKSDADPAGTWTTPADWGAEIVSSAKLEKQLRRNLQCSGPFRRRFYIDPFTNAAATGATFVADATQPLGFYASFGAQNQTMEWDVVLPAGAITVTLIGVTGPTAGKAHVIWDGVDQGSGDFYSAGPVNNVRKTVSWTNATPKKARLQIKNADKNASSSAFVLRIHRICIGFADPIAGWADPKHFPADALITVADLNTNGWRSHMRMRAEMPWLIDIDPLTPMLDSNMWETYSKNDAWYYFCALITNSGFFPGSDGYWVEWDVPLAAGTYDCSIVAAQSTDAGQVDVLLDGTAVVSNADFYHATAVASKVVTTTGIVVATTKTYRVRVRVNSKNASAAHYYCALNRLRFRRTA